MIVKRGRFCLEVKGLYPGRSHASVLQVSVADAPWTAEDTDDLVWAVRRAIRHSICVTDAKSIVLIEPQPTKQP